MRKNCFKPALACLLIIGLHAGSVSMNIVHAYDGDIDYSAPYVTLDPKTGKLITVDPKQQPADGQAQPPHPNAPPQDATASTSQDTSATSTMTTAAAPATTEIPAGASTPTTPSSSGTNVMAAVLGLVLIAGVVAVLRRKPATEKSDS